MTLLPDVAAFQRCQQRHPLLHDDCRPAGTSFEDDGGHFALVADDGAVAVLYHTGVRGDMVRIVALVVAELAAWDRMLRFFADRFLADVGTYTRGIELTRHSLVRPVGPAVTRNAIVARFADFIATNKGTSKSTADTA